MPFAAEPDMDCVYFSSTHGEAFAHLLYAAGPYGGFTQLTGPSGSGKTLLVRALLAQNLPDVDLISIAYPPLGEFEFVRAICDELAVDYAGNTRSLKVLIDALNRHLLATYAAGRRTILIVDEAQRLPRSVLEQVRLLTNLETAKHKLLRIILVGSAELHDLLSRQNLRQLSSRITARYHLHALGEAETQRYIRHRLQAAGAGEGLMSRDAMRVVHRYSQGIPRLINQLCDCALHLASRLHARKVDAVIARQAVAEVLHVSVIDPVRQVEPILRLAKRIPLVKISMIACTALLAVLLIRVWPERALLPAAPADVGVAERAPESTPTVSETATPVARGISVSKPARARIDRSAAKPRSRVSPAQLSASLSPGSGARPVPQTEKVLASVAASVSAPLIITTPVVVTAEQQAPSRSAASLPADAGLPELLQVDQPLPRLMTRLAQLWDRGIALPADADVCGQLSARGLQCRAASGELDVLRELNRPAVLLLDIGGGRHRRVLLRALSANFASIEGAVGTLVIPNEVLTSLWTGEYTAIVESDEQMRSRAPRLLRR